MKTVKEVTEWLNDISDDNHVGVSIANTEFELVEVESAGSNGRYNNSIDIGGTHMRIRKGYKK